MDQHSRAFRPESLLAHREWVERAARALVYGDADAEDLRQQAWLEILERPPQREPKYPRGWLRSVLRFTAIDAARAARTRHLHEVAAAKRERIDASPAELVARAETLDRVAHAVLELDEPYRATVLLRYFEGLEARAIAELQGIPVETVRTRLKRAVAQLRERLDAENEGDRRRWCLALLPLFRRPSSGTATGAASTATAAAGALLMSLKVKIAVATAVLLVVGGGYALLRLGGERGPGAWTPPRVAVVPLKEAVPIRPVEPPSPAGAPSLVVRVEDANGKPMPGALVEVRPARPGKFATWCGDRLLQSGTTDADGVVFFKMSAEDLAHAREVRAHRPGFITATTRSNGTEVVLRLSNAAILGGRVVEATTGRGIVGVELLVVRGGDWPREEVARTVSGPDGAFTFDDLPPGTVTLQARPCEWLETEVEDLLLKAGESRTVQVLLDPGTKMVGRVLDSDTRTAIPGGRLVLPARPGLTADKVATLDPEGGFALSGLPSWANTSPPDSFLLVADGYDRTASTEVPAAYDMEGHQTRDAVLLARRETSWSARVVDPEGRPVPGARVVIGVLSMLGELDQLDGKGSEYAGHVRGRLREAVTDADGRCRLPAGWLMRAQGNNSWEQRLFVLHPGFAPHYESVGPTYWNAPGEIRLEQGIQLVVEVTGPDGRPESGAELRSVLRDPFKDFPFVGDPFGSLVGPAITDHAGRVTLPHLCAGEWQLRVWSADGLRNGAATIQVGDSGPLLCRMALGDAPAVFGTVVDEETDKPLPGAVVRMGRGGLSGHLSAVADAEGHFEFRFAEQDPLQPGFDLYVGAVPAPGVWHPSGRVQAQAGVAVTVRAQCTIRETRDVSIRVLDAITGAPVPKGLIGFHWRDPRVPTTTHNGSRPFTSGRYSGWIPVVDGLRISFDAAGYETRNTTPGELESLGFEIRLVPKGPQDTSAAKYRLRVKVTAAGLPATTAKIPYGTAWVYLYDPETKRPFKRRGTEWDLQAPPGNLPEFVLTEHQLPGPGRVLLELQVPGWYMAAPAECIIEPGKESEVAIDLLEGGGTLSGTADAKPGEVVVLLTYPSGVVRRLGVGEEGKFWAGQLAPGTYTLAIEGSEPTPVVVKGGARTDVTLKK